MKKIVCLFILCCVAISMFACQPETTTTTTSTTEPTTSSTVKPGPDVEDTVTKSEGVMTWEEYNAADLESEVTIEAYVQGKQAWWFNSDKNTGLGTFYLQDGIGGYFLYEMPCTEEEYNSLTVGTKVKVTGYKAEWAGEVEIIDAEFEIIEGNYVAEPSYVTDLLGKDELANYQNMLVRFEGLTVVGWEYQNGTRGKDIYVTLNHNGAEFSFCVESYLTSSDSDLYKAVEALKAGDVVNVEGFAYWYNGINTHITAVEVKGNINDKSEGTMTWNEYIAADLESEVVIEAYVQGKQAWWFNSDKNTGLGTFYLQDGDGAYFLYEMPCTEEEYNSLTVGTKVKVTGYKAEWAGEVEIIEATFEILEGNYVAAPIDITELLGTDELVNYQNMLVAFNGLTVVGIEYQNGARGKDIYVTVSLNNNNYSFCVESYLTSADSDLYKAVEALKAGDTVDVIGFAYWYNGINTHITSITVK